MFVIKPRYNSAEKNLTETAIRESMRNRVWLITLPTTKFIASPIYEQLFLSQNYSLNQFKVKFSRFVFYSYFTNEIKNWFSICVLKFGSSVSHQSLVLIGPLRPRKRDLG